MAEAQCADQQPGHDLVANAEQRRGIEHAMTQGDRGTHRDHVAAEQRQVHARLALRHAVAHRRHPARNLRGRSGLAGENLDLLGIAPVRLMRRQHVVIGGDDADVGAGKRLDRLLVVTRGREPVSEIAARHARPADAALFLFADQLEIVPPLRLGPLDDPVGDPGHGCIERHCFDSCGGPPPFTRAS